MVDFVPEESDDIVIDCRYPRLYFRTLISRMKDRSVDFGRSKSSRSRRRG